MFQGVLLIYNLLDLKYQITDDSTIKLETLESAFYGLKQIISIATNQGLDLTFEEVIEYLLEEFPHLFNLFDDEISFAKENPDIIFEEIKSSFEEEITEFDQDTKEFIHTILIYRILNLPIPIEEAQPFFELSKNLSFTYQILAKQEIEQKNQEQTRKIISFLEYQLESMMRKTTKKDRVKMKVCLAECCAAYLSEEDTPNINEPWHIAILSNNPKLKKTLLFDKIEYWCRKLDEEEYAEKKEKEKTKAEKEDIIFELDDAEAYFLTTYIMYLNHWTKETQDIPTREYLIRKKYLLLSLSDAIGISTYYLETGSIDDLDLPILEAENSDGNCLDFIVASFEEILANIKKTDSELKQAIELRPWIIMNLLILKCYLDLPTNKEIKQELLGELTNPTRYKNPEYSMLSNLIDEIIFKEENLNRLREKK